MPKLPMNAITFQFILNFPLTCSNLPPTPLAFFPLLRDCTSRSKIALSLLMYSYQADLNDLQCHLQVNTKVFCSTLSFFFFLFSNSTAIDNGNSGIKTLWLQMRLSGSGASGS